MKNESRKTTKATKNTKKDFIGTGVFMKGLRPEA
jgi:hypothetical protein